MAKQVIFALWQKLKVFAIKKYKRGCKKIKSILVFAANAVHFKKNEDISLFFLPSPLGKVSTELTKEVIKKDLSKFIKK